ncbi:MAG: class I SAM-dependent methyltransferase [Anaerolineales bacterium]
MSHKHYARRYYDDPAHAQAFEKGRFYGRFGAFLQRWDQDLFLRSPLLQLGPGAQILDAGAGTGRLTIPLCREFPRARVTALDFSDAMLAQLTQKSAGLPNPPRILRGDVLETGFESGQFDLVISSRVLMHLPDWERGLTELCRVSKDYLVFDFPPTRSVGAFGKGLSSQNRVAEAYTYLRLKDVKHALSGQGFAVLDVKKSFVLPIRAHLKLNAPAISKGAEGLFRLVGLTALLGAPVFVLARRSQTSH